MKRYLLIIVMFYVVLSTGCSKTQNENIALNYEFVQNELEKAQAENNEFEKNLSDAEATIADLEKQISDLKEEVGKLSKQEVVEQEPDKFNELKIIKVDENVIKFVLDKTSIVAQSVSIVGSNTEDIVENYEEIHFESPGSGGEYFKAKVIGSIYNFQLIELEWNDEVNKLEEVRIIRELEEVKNQVIHIKTTLPCGMPSQKIKWKDSKGDIHEIYLANDGFGFDGSIIWSD